MIPNHGTPRIPDMRRISSVLTASIVFAAVVLGVSVAPRPASADWPPFGRAVNTAAGNQAVSAIATDDAGGAIITWVDFRDSAADIFAGRVLASGELDAAWPVNGRGLRTDPDALGDEPEDPAFPVIVADGAGGAIVAWQDGRSGATGTDIYAQHILASGAVDPAWPANGVALCVVPGVQDIPTIVADGAGGAIVTWMDGRDFSLTSIDIYAQHVLSTGAVDPAWPANGRALCTAPTPQAFPTIASDGAGGAIVTWYDFRSGVTSIDIYAQRVLSSGVVDPAWPVNGRALCTAIREQFEPKIVADGAGGAIVTWYDVRSGTNRVFAQHVLASGAVDPAWPVDGRAVTNGALSEESPKLVSDGAGGAIVVWQARGNGLLNVFAQHLTSAGQVDPSWPANGRALNTTDTGPNQFAVVEDGAGGAIVAWATFFVDIFAHHVLASGALDPAYPANGRPVCELPSDERSLALVATGEGGAIAAWSDNRNGVGNDVFAMQVLAAGTVDVPAPASAGITFAPPSPNPASGPFALRFALQRQAHVRLAIYDAAGRRVRELASGDRPAGEHALVWDLRDEGGREVGAGIYFARLELERLVLMRTLVTLR
jgi:hypothetical protein